MNNISEIKEKKVTFIFIQLFKKYEIEIPIIQRDYSQGRTTTNIKNIRDTFLNKGV